MRKTLEEAQALQQASLETELNQLRKTLEEEQALQQASQETELNELRKTLDDVRKTLDDVQAWGRAQDQIRCALPLR